MLTQAASLSAEQIVKLLGGPTSLARHPELVAQRSAIANWPTEGIPARHWPALARIAAEKPETQHITILVLERHTRPSKAVAA